MHHKLSPEAKSLAAWAIFAIYRKKAILVLFENLIKRFENFCNL